MVAKENIPFVWQAMEDDIRAARDTHGAELSLKLLREDLCKGEHQLWLCAIDTQVFGWAISAIVSYGELRRLRFLLLGGFDMEMWLRYIEEIEQWARKEMKVDEVEAWVRPGLRKKLAAFGYEKSYEMVVKKIPERIAN